MIKEKLLTPAAILFIILYIIIIIFYNNKSINFPAKLLNYIDFLSV